VASGGWMVYKYFVLERNGGFGVAELISCQGQQISSQNRPVQKGNG